MNGTELATVLSLAFARLANASDELRELDAAVGDGDLGITVTKGAEAVGLRLSELAPGVLPGDVILVTAEAFGEANPSTFASLVSSGLVAGVQTVNGLEELSTPEIVALGKTAAATIMRRGKSSVGDKTLLDALVPSLDAAELHAHDGAMALEAAIVAAAIGIDSVTGIAANKGRAAWAAERGIGIPDAGATAYLRFLDALTYATTEVNDQMESS
jgi:dihydroxyacetone kinase-like protein